eukprot:4598894-Pleurochrysis_carterae.AAC.2
MRNGLHGAHSMLGAATRASWPMALCWMSSQSCVGERHGSGPSRSSRALMCLKSVCGYICIHPSDACAESERQESKL